MISEQLPQRHGVTHINRPDAGLAHVANLRWDELHAVGRYDICTCSTQCTAQALAHCAGSANYKDARHL